MSIEIDLSGKIEEYKDTVVAFRNKEQYAVLLKRILKKELLTKYRAKHRDIVYRLFAILIFYCIKNYVGKEKLIIIDNDYEGRDIDIKKHLLRFLWMELPNFDKRLIKFSNIGKRSNAHRIAYQTYSKKLAPNKILSKKDVEDLL